MDISDQERVFSTLVRPHSRGGKKHLPGNLYQTRNNQCSIKPIIYASYATIYNAYGIISLNPHTKETIEATPLIFAAA